MPVLGLQGRQFVRLGDGPVVHQSGHLVAVVIVQEGPQTPVDVDAGRAVGPGEQLDEYGAVGGGEKVHGLGLGCRRGGGQQDKAREQ